VHLNTQLLDGQCRPQLKELIARCLAPEPAARFSGAASLRQALMGLLAG
jgi:hypothetical protein